MTAFVIRVWAPDDEVEAHAHHRSELCGVLEQVGSRHSTTFKSDDELLRVLRERLSASAPEPEGTRRPRC